MSNKQGYNTTEIGKVPEDWDIVKLGDVCEVYDNKRIPLSEEQRKDIKGTYPYCGANGIIDYINKYIFDGEYVLLAEDGGYWGSFQQSAYLMSGKFWVNNHAHILKAIEGKAVNKFLVEVLNFLDLTPFITGSTRGKLNQLRMRFIIAPLPPFEEQKRIALILSSVDEAIQKTAEIIQKAQELKKGLMQQLLTKGIGHTKFKQTEIGEIPVEWLLDNFSSVCRIIDCKHRTPKYAETGYPIVRPSDVKSGHLSLGNCKLTSYEEFLDLTSKYAPKRGDVIFSRNASFGIASYVATDEKFATGQDVVVITSDVNSTLFYFYVLDSQIIANQLRRLSTGSTFRRINLEEIRKFRVPVPPKEEQERIASVLSEIDEKIEKEKQRKEQLEKLKKGLMQDLLTGKVRVKVN
jgi:type I restriction enzyme S subunit